MNFITAKELLAESASLSKTKTRHSKNEFQAYAYKLAMDLNDLVNLKIYMRLAKNIERNLMEQAFRFVADSNSSDKGRLFLWKLKAIRTEIEHKRALQNFDYSFVRKKTGEFRNIFYSDIFKVTDKDFDDNKKHIITTNCNGSLLIIGGATEKILKSLLPYFSITVWENSSKIALELKKVFLGQKRIKIVNKDLLKKGDAKKKFSLIWANNLWQNTPLLSEITVLKKLKSLLELDGKLFIPVKHSFSNKEEWKVYKIDKEVYYYFLKITTKSNFIANAKKFNFKVQELWDKDNIAYFLLSM